MNAKATEAHGIDDGEDTRLEQSTSCCRSNRSGHYLEEQQEENHCDRRVARELHSEGRGDYHPSEDEEENPSRLDDKACKGREEAANGESCMSDDLKVK